MEAQFVWLARHLVANVMESKWPVIGTKRAQGGHESLEVSIGGDELPVQ